MNPDTMSLIDCCAVLGEFINKDRKEHEPVCFPDMTLDFIAASLPSEWKWQEIVWSHTDEAWCAVCTRPQLEGPKPRRTHVCTDGYDKDDNFIGNETELLARARCAVKCWMQAANK